jgi:hypothetical protein
MRQTFDIVLPKADLAIFPDRCIYSSESGADDSVLVIANSQNPILSFFAPILLLFGWKSVRAPIKKKYKIRYYFTSYGRDIIMILLAFLFVFAVMPSFDRSDSFRKIKGAGIVLLMLSPWIAFEVLFPRRFDITVTKDSISYEFTDEIFADEFAEINYNEKYGA